MISKRFILSVRSQCDLLSINRSGFYYQPTGESKENLLIMNLLDRHILEEPTTGVLTMLSMLLEKGIKASYERVRRLMRKANKIGSPIITKITSNSWKFKNAS